VSARAALAALAALGVTLGCRDSVERSQPAEVGIESGLVAAALARADVRWERDSTAHFRLFAVAGTPAAARLDRLGAAAERARTAALALLGEAEYPRPVTLLFLPTREAMRGFVGWPAGGWGIAAEDAAFFVATDSLHPALRHELMHVFSWNAWGPPFGGESRGQWISEGLAVLAPGGCQGIGLHAIAGALGHEGRLVSWASMDTAFDARTFASNVQAGSVVGFVRERHGVRGVRTLWRRGLAGLAELAGTTPDSLERAWRALVSDAPPIPTGESAAELADRVRREGCEPLAD
jgi:hypothetical protein